MPGWLRLFDLIGGKPLKEEEDGPATRYRIMIGATLATTVFAALYGLAAGSTSLTLAIGDVFKMPMVMVLSALSAVPACLLCWKLSGGNNKATDFLMGLTTANLTASLVLAVMSPIVALYYHTSASVGGVLALGTAGLAMILGLASGVRAIRLRIPEEERRHATLPMVAMLGMQLAVLLQLVHVASPILPELTLFDYGIDGIVR